MRMEKPFLEVFPGLHINEDLKELLKLVEVEKITMTKDRSSIRIYIVSPRLIHKKNIYNMEEGIAKQLFPGRQIRVKIQEKYRLSAQYTPRTLYDVYKDSIQLEFKQFGVIESNILRKAKAEFQGDDRLVMTIEDNLIYKERSKEVVRVLEKIFTERCGLPAEVVFRYTEPVERKDRPEGPALEGEIPGGGEAGTWVPGRSGGSGLKSASSKSGAQGGFGDSGGKTKNSQPKNGEDGKKQEFGKKSFGEFKKNGGGSGFKGRDGNRSPYRKSENPDVLFGRDFDGDSIEIRDIEGEIGDVTLRGKILRVEDRKSVV